MNKLQQEKSLKQMVIIRDLFDEHGIDYWLDSGTALCIYRDGNLKNTEDIDIGVHVRDAWKIEAISKKLRKLLGGLTHFPYQWYFKTTNTSNGQLMFYADTGNYYSCYGLRLHFAVPKKFHPEKNTNILVFENEPFKIPAFIEEYLELYYGPSWKEPLSSYLYYKLQQDMKEGKEPLFEVHQPKEEVIKYWKGCHYKLTYEVRNEHHEG